MSLIGFVPALIAMIGGAGIAAIIWRTSNKDMPADRMDALYAKRRELLEKKRRSVEKRTSTPSKQSADVVAQLARVAMTERMPAKAEGRSQRTEGSVAEKKRKIIHIRHLVYKSGSKKPMIVQEHFPGLDTDSVSATYIVPELPDITFVPVEDVKITASGTLENASGVMVGIRSAFTGEFTAIGERGKRRGGRHSKQKPA
ncbi:hypothetical protein [Brucella anthropi]|uniref:hypothetical protein n=1 Tax=Brucella anthropi TaxID=529 RepID=UPI00125DCFC8|nr:hypothetical protein [Brucella anthropi]QFP61866.1 hypothetical protein FT787_01450 [Brucella anthropi]